jgi:hypothetical protein
LPAQGNSRALKISIAILAGYAAGALVGYLLVEALSPNRHDRALEAVITAFLVMGPVGAAVGAISAFLIWRKRRERS